MIAKEHIMLKDSDGETKMKKKQMSDKEIPERWYEVFGMGNNLPEDFSEDNKNVLRIPGHYFMRF